MPPVAFLHIEDISNLTDITRNILAAAAIVVGAIWAYHRFVRERTRWPRATLNLEFTDRLLDDSRRLLSVKLHVTNEGLGLMRLTQIRFDIFRVLPYGDEMRVNVTAGCAHLGHSLEADWPCISSREYTWPKKEKPEIEPRESDEFVCDFFIEPSEDFVFLYAYIDNEKKGRIRQRSLGWRASAFHQLPPSKRSDRLRRLLKGGAG
jgi:hypothetical protein